MLHLLEIRINMKNICIPFGIALLLLLFGTAHTLQAQTCDCKEYIYLNEPAIGAVLKFEVGAGVPLTEVTGSNGPGHWYPGSGVSALPSPHGLGTDLNGRLYIGSSFAPNTPIRRFNCDGQIEPQGPATINNQFNLTNMFSIGNTIYTTRSSGPAAYNSCTGALIGTMCLNDQNGNPLPFVNSTLGTDVNWGLSYNETTQKVYVTGVAAPRRSVWVFTKAQLEAGIAGGPCISPLIPLGTTSVLNPGDNFLPNNIEDLRGVVSDNAGNIYVSGWYADLSGFVLKYNAAGQFIAATALSPNYKLSIGIVWSEVTNRIYVTNGTDDPAVDCISAFNAVSMAYLGTAAPNPNVPDNNAGKALAIIKECCPVGLPAAFTKNVCGAVGTKFYLNEEAFSTCDGIVCGSSWIPQGVLTGMTFDPCDNSVTITTAGTACGTFTLNIGAVSSTGCTAQTSTFTICNNPTLQFTPTVSGCYQNGGSKTTVSVEVSWSNLGVSPTVNDNSDQITVTFGGQTRYINPGAYTSTGGNGTIVSPQVVAFEVNADGSSQIVQVFIGNDYASASCKIQQTGIPLPAPCPPTVCASGQTGGTVFNDYNADGIQQAGETVGLLGVTVSAYDCNGNIVGTTTTDVDGNYLFTSIPNGAYPIRVEFSGLPAVYSQGTPNGSDGRTTVQFVSAADCDIDLGVLNPQDYCQANPKIVLPCYVVGDPQHPDSATDGALVGVNYDMAGSNTYYATIPQLGTVWGTAYKKSNNTVYSAAFVKRHSGLGPDGLGAIYQTNIISNTTSLFANVTALGVNLGNISSNTTRVLGAKTAANADPEAFAKAGKVGMGDIDISEDGSTLYFVNLFERKLHSINIANPTTAPGVDIPNPGCNGGEFRPWALKVYQGKVYVGVVCDAGTSQSKSDLRAYVYAYDITSGTFNTTPVFDFPLTYPKGFAIGGTAGLIRTGWYPWTDDFSTLLANGFVSADPVVGGTIIYPTPVLSDIEFDTDGSMVFGFMDRIGMQLGAQQLGVNGTGVFSIAVGGDILRAYSKGGTFVLENNGKAGPASGYGPDNNQGPGFGEFYNDDFSYFGTLAHSENSQGALAIRPGSGETVYTAMDPVSDVANSGGVRKVSNTTGLATGAYTVVSGFGANGLFDKAQSLGDIELGCASPTYLQIGNYVWVDTDRDGVQDPCESPLPGVSVSLYKIVAGTPTLVAVTTTGANGEYYFTDNTVAGETWLNGATGLLPNMDYKIVFGYNGQTSTAQYTANNLLIGGNNYILTALNVGEGANIDLNDSDASLMAIAGASYPSIDVTTGTVGTVNHTYDAGFWFCQDISSPSAAQSICAGDVGNDITVQTTSNAAGSIRFVRFTTDQMAGAVPSAAEALAIYSGATVGAAVTPTGLANPYTATLTTSAAGWNTLAPGTYYVYAILNPYQGAACRPVQEIIVTIASEVVEAGIPATICRTRTLALSSLGASVTPLGLAATWTTSGDGTFTGGTSYASATEYVPGPNDIATGSVTLTLTSNTVGSPCPVATDAVTITILKVNCGTFPWNGN
jgi:hypothetical protein